MRFVMRRTVAAILAVLTLAVPLTAAPALPAAAQETAGPQRVVQQLNEALLDVMQNARQLGFQGRYQRLAPVLPQVFDFATMARFAVGQTNFDRLDPGQQARLIEAFSQMSLATYAARFDGYSGERFEITAAEPAPRNAVMVRTQLVRPSGTPVLINYVLRPSGNQWKILDVFLEGTISELSRQRSEYTAVFRRDGFEGLLAAINRVTSRMASANGSAG